MQATANHSRIPAGETANPFIVYRLGPTIPLARPLPSGPNYRATRFKVALDLLLTSPTLKEALAQTKKRTGSATEPD